MTVWEERFGTPERAARTIVDDCHLDCYACPFSDAPCFSSFGAGDDDYVSKVLEWLESEVES